MGNGTEWVAGFRVAGRVQGVGFRWWTRKHAQELGLRGSVRNLPDGTVEVLAAGDSDAVAALRAWLREGPPGAQVSSVAEIPVDPGDLPDDRFEITR